MLFEPPRIETIKDVLPFVQDNPGFIIKEKDWYSVIDYLYMTDKMFHNEIERECRGLKFCSKTGKILGRPYHKFHNLNERLEYRTENVDLNKPHVILDKLDGSMVHTCPSPLGIYLMTRMGLTEVAKKADEFLMRHRYRYGKLLSALPVDEYTYIFEYVGPDNKIVLDYKKEDLILTAIRHTNNGTYVFHDELVKLGKTFGVRVVEAFPFDGFDNSMEKVANAITAQTDTEGYVVRFDTGAMVKIKCDEYVRKHRTKDLVSSQKGIIKLIAEKTLDDILPQLDDDVKKQVLRYQEEINNALDMRAMTISAFIKARDSYTQKDFALDVKEHVAKPLHAVTFNTRKTCDARQELVNLLHKNCSTNKKINELLDNLKWPKWTFSFFAEE